MLLEIKNLCTSYGNIKALRGVSMAVKEGQIIALIGANGAGKTTLLKTVAGLLKPAAGTIIYCGEDITKVPPQERVKEGIILCPEGRQIFPRFTVMENLHLGSYTMCDRRLIQESYERVFALFPILKEREKQIAGTLSGGEQQMLAIGRALMAKPKLLMLDEPSLGLSPLLVDQIFDLIRQINAQGVTILLVEQNAMAALEIAEHAYTIVTGTIELEGSGKELLINDEVIKSYLGA